MAFVWHFWGWRGGDVNGGVMKIKCFLPDKVKWAVACCRGPGVTESQRALLEHSQYHSLTRDEVQGLRLPLIFLTGEPFTLGFFSGEVQFAILWNSFFHILLFCPDLCVDSISKRGCRKSWSLFNMSLSPPSEKSFLIDPKLI